MSLHGYEAVIGLEVHAQLLTKTKLFCGCSTTFGGTPNGQTCPVCLGMPGSLPVLNKRAVDFAIKFGLAVHANPVGTSVFERKNYFYPDLPKGYQISQFEAAVVGPGHVDIDLEDGSTKRIRLNRAHLEEDAGQSSHDGHPQSRSKSYVNLNRSGVPLLEIVTEPDLRSADEAYAYLTELKSIVQYLDICDGNMEEGSLRCDANVSVRPIGQQELGTKTELKNLNSFNNVRRAIQHEIDRQITTLLQGGTIIQSTLLWDVDAQTTRVMRTKEDSHDYRYFPDPDLLPLTVNEEQVDAARGHMPELPRQKYHRLINDYGIPAQDARLLTSDRDMAMYFESAVAACNQPKAVANWIMGDLLRDLNANNLSISECPIAAEQLGELVNLIQDDTISGKIGKKVIVEMFKTGKGAHVVIEEKGLKQITDTSAIDAIVSDILAKHPQQVEEYRGGKEKVLGFFVGQIMKQTKGQANPGMVNKLLKEKLAG
jgi:aspartyl-tRNA(Asn)/glutamyl-tRNA(Gln) amidotransferase subunit B